MKSRNWSKEAEQQFKSMPKNYQEDWGQLRRELFGK